MHQFARLSSKVDWQLPVHPQPMDFQEEKASRPAKVYDAAMELALMFVDFADKLEALEVPESSPNVLHSARVTLDSSIEILRRLDLHFLIVDREFVALKRRLPPFQFEGFSNGLKGSIEAMFPPF
jgi:hypothetical protein